MDPKETLRLWNVHLSNVVRALQQGNLQRARDELEQASDYEQHLVQWSFKGGKLPKGFDVAIKRSMRITLKAVEANVYTKGAVNPSRMRRSKKNPVRHFPKLKGRGRPTKLKTWEMTTVLSNGAVAVRSGLKATTEQAHKRADAILKKRFKGRKVREVILDDGR